MGRHSEDMYGLLKTVGGGDGCNIWHLCPDDLSSDFNNPLDGFLFCLSAAEGPGSHTVCQHILYCILVETDQQPLW